MWHIYTEEYYSATKKNKFETVTVRQMNLEPVTQCAVRQKLTVFFT